MLTLNEKKVLRMLLTAFGENYSINYIAKKCGISPNGSLKILHKFEKEGILNSKKIANIKSYYVNFENEKTRNIFELALISEPKGRLKYRFDDLKQLKSITYAGAIFGSYIDEKIEPNDMDILIILDKKKFKIYKEKAREIYPTVPVKVHEVLQTEDDFSKNLLDKDKVLIGILRTGIILWGHRNIINLIENGHKK